MFFSFELGWLEQSMIEDSRDCKWSWGLIKFKAGRQKICFVIERSIKS